MPRRRTDSKPRPRGRPPKRAADRQRYSVTARLTRAEYEALEEVAGDEPFGVYLRRLVLRHLARRRS